jgi:hypothetical protein
MILGALLIAWAYTLLNNPPPGSDDAFWGIVWGLIGIASFIKNFKEDEWW